MEVSGEQTRWWGLLKGGVGSRLLSELKLLVTGTFEHIVERNRNVFLGWREGGWQNLGEGAGPRGACLMWGRDPVAGAGAGGMWTVSPACLVAPSRLFDLAEAECPTTGGGGLFLASGVARCHQDRPGPSHPGRQGPPTASASLLFTRRVHNTGLSF